MKLRPANQQLPRSFGFWGDLSFGYFLLALQPALVKVLSSRLSSMQTVFLRFSFAALCILVLCLARGRGIRTKQPLWSAVRGVSGAVAVYFYFSAVSEVGAARAALLNYTYPFWANFFAWLLGARPSRRFWWGLLTAFLGVAIVVSPAELSSGFSLRPGDIKGLLSAIFAGGSVLVIKQLRKTDEALSIVGAFTVGGLLLSSWGHSQKAALSTLIDPEVGLFAWGVGATSFFGHVFFTRGYKGATVQQATLLSLTVPVIASLLGAMLGEPLGFRFFLGAGMVAFALVYVAQENSAKRPERK